MTVEKVKPTIAELEAILNSPEKFQVAINPDGSISAKTLSDEIAEVINRHSAENGSDTPDFILGQYLTSCLQAYNAAVQAREKWYGRACGNGAQILDAGR